MTVLAQNYIFVWAAENGAVVDLAYYFNVDIELLNPRK